MAYVFQLRKIKHNYKLNYAIIPSELLMIQKSVLYRFKALEINIKGFPKLGRQIQKDDSRHQEGEKLPHNMGSSSSYHLTTIKHKIKTIKSLGATEKKLTCYR